MSSHLAVLASLALAIFFSPETLVLGLVIAGDRKVPRAAAIAFAIGAVAGITFATGIGLWIAHASGTDAAARHGSWPGFIVRVMIAAALLTIGAYRAVNAFRQQPIMDISQPDQKPSKFRVLLTKRFPKLMRQLDASADLTVPQRIGRAGLAGFAISGLHPKVFPIAIAAGHQIVQITNPGTRSLGVALFATICVVPAVLPAVIELINPGGVVRIKESYERIMKVHGRWISAVLLLGAGAFVAHEAWRVIPRS
jgi:threonine/homoserine/homoserine lactone efflux protein